MNSKFFSVLAVVVLSTAWAVPSFSQTETKTANQQQSPQSTQQTQQQPRAGVDGWRRESSERLDFTREKPYEIKGSRRPSYPSAPCMDFGYSYGLSCSYLYSPQWSGRWPY